ncbi:MAG: DUF1616 domain-containing protein [Candidatus Bathyarchaeia archaeon]
MTRQEVITRQTTDQIKDYIVSVVKIIKPLSAQELMPFVQQRFLLSQEEITAILLQLESEEKVLFIKKSHQASNTLKDYVFSLSAVWYWLTLIIALLTTFSIFVISEDAFPLIYLRQAVGITFVGFLPGFVLLKTIYPSRVQTVLSSENPAMLDRIMLSIGLSIALVAIDGLVLNYTPFGISLVPVTLTLLVFTAVFATVGILREYAVNSALTCK